MGELTLAEKIDADEMVNQFEELQDRRFRPVPAGMAKGLLPKRAEYRRGKLRVPNQEASDADYSGLTTLGKKILSSLADGLTPAEIEDRGTCSRSYISRTERDFGFLLKSPVLYSAYVIGGKISPNGYVLCCEDSEYGVEINTKSPAPQIVADFQQALDCKSKVVSVNDTDDPETIQRNDPNPGKKEQYVDLSEFETEPESMSTSEDKLDQDVEQEAENLMGEMVEDHAREVIFTREDWKEIVKVLYQSDSNELASKIIDEKL